MKQRVLVTRADLPGGGLARLASGAEIVCPPGADKPGPAELAERAEGAAAILALGNDRVDAALLDAAGPALRVVALA
ncbi:D-glycerate dehydrogenase, partial [Streptomyces sp. 2MCAF27]